MRNRAWLAWSLYLPGFPDPVVYSTSELEVAYSVCLTFFDTFLKLIVPLAPMAFNDKDFYNLIRHFVIIFPFVCFTSQPYHFLECHIMLIIWETVTNHSQFIFLSPFLILLTYGITPFSLLFFKREEFETILSHCVFHYSTSGLTAFSRLSTLPCFIGDSLPWTSQLPPDTFRLCSKIKQRIQ